VYVKAQAVRKLTYLQMLGYDMSWANFSIVEVMSQPRFAHKRIGFLAGCQIFTESTDLVLLTTNLLKKEFQSQDQYDVGLAVNCAANIVTRELGRDLLTDVTALMSHTKPYVRKKAVSCLFKLYMAYPQGLRLTFEKLSERFADEDPSVTSCAVNVICELASKASFCSTPAPPPLTHPRPHRTRATTSTWLRSSSACSKRRRTIGCS